MNRLRNGAAIESKHPTEPFYALDRARGQHFALVGFDQSVVERLMTSLCVIMIAELANRLPKRSFSEEDHPTETFSFDRKNEPLRVCIQIRRTRRQAHDFSTGILQQIPERQRKLRVTIQNQKPFVGKESGDWGSA